MQKLAAAGAVPRGRHGPAPPQVRDGGYTCLLSAFFFPRPFPACLFSFVRGSDISLPPRILLRRRASCFQPRAFVSCPCPVNVLSVSSQPLLNLLSVSSQPPVLPRLTRRTLASSPHIVASPSHASLIACLHYFSRSPCTYPQVLKLKFLKFGKILQNLRHLQFFAEISRKINC